MQRFQFVTHLIELHRVFDLLHLIHSVLDHLLDIYFCPLQLCLHNIISHILYIADDRHNLV